MNYILYVPSETYPKLYKLAATNRDAEKLWISFVIHDTLFLNIQQFMWIYACAVTDIAF
jgi:hypothetical protein